MQSPGKLCWQLKSAHQPLLAGLVQAGEEASVPLQFGTCVASDTGLDLRRLRFGVNHVFNRM